MTSEEKLIKKRFNKLIIEYNKVDKETENSRDLLIKELKVAESSIIPFKWIKYSKIIKNSLLDITKIDEVSIEAELFESDCWKYLSKYEQEDLVTILENLNRRRDRIEILKDRFIVLLNRFNTFFAVSVAILSLGLAVTSFLKSFF